MKFIRLPPGIRTPQIPSVVGHGANNVEPVSYLCHHTVCGEGGGNELSLKFLKKIKRFYGTPIARPPEHGRIALYIRLLYSWKDLSAVYRCHLTLFEASIVWAEGTKSQEIKQRKPNRDQGATDFQPLYDTCVHYAVVGEWNNSYWYYTRCNSSDLRLRFYIFTHSCLKTAVMPFDGRTNQGGFVILPLSRLSAFLAQYLPVRSYVLHYTINYFVDLPFLRRWLSRPCHLRLNLCRVRLFSGEIAGMHRHPHHILTSNHHCGRAVEKKDRRQAVLARPGGLDSKKTQTSAL